MDPLVSIITPTYNAARFIGETIRSALIQTHQSFELLVADDASRDGTPELIERLASDDPRVRLLRHAENRGPAAARNTALEASRGQFIAFLDSDDLWLPEKLKIQLHFMREAGAAISYTSYSRISARGELISGPVLIPRTLDYVRLLKNTAIATSTAIVDRTQVGPFQMINTYYDDYALWLTLTRRGHVAHGLQQDLMRYRVVSGSVSRNKLRSARHVWEIYRSVERLPLRMALWCFAHYVWNGWNKYRA